MSSVSNAMWNATNCINTLAPSHLKSTSSSTDAAALTESTKVLKYANIDEVFLVCAVLLDLELAATLADNTEHRSWG